MQTQNINNIVCTTTSHDERRVQRISRFLKDQLRNKETDILYNILRNCNLSVEVGRKGRVEDLFYKYKYIKVCNPL